MLLMKRVFYNSTIESCSLWRVYTVQYLGVIWKVVRRNVESSEDELHNGFLRNGRRFRSGKMRKVAGRRRDYSLPREGEYGCEWHLDEGSCDEEEEYSTIFEREESEESTETPRTGCDYDIPRRSPEVRPRSSSPEPLVNTSSPNVKTSAQGIPSTILVNPTNTGSLVNNPSATLMAGRDLRLPTFNGNAT